MAARRLSNAAQPTSYNGTGKRLEKPLSGLSREAVCTVASSRYDTPPPTE